MEFTAVIIKNTLNLVDVIPTEHLSNLIQNTEGFELVPMLLDPEIVVSGVDTLSARRNNSTIEVYSDPAKYSTCTMMKGIREHRDTLLKLTDWSVLPDITLDEETKQELIDYRKQLRDITNSNSYPHTIILPKHRLVKPPWENVDI
tara:strand:+ start:26 stop:463 length:438 start_codon:yes stop_codon:yes gene_type:complete